MRKIIAGFAISLDGYIEGPHGEYDWIIMDKDLDITAEMSKYDTFLYGRRSYEAVANMAASFDGYSNIVVSSTLKDVKSGFTLLNNNIETKIRELKSQPGKNIAVYGGAKLLSSLLEMKLVDEISMTVIPVLLGAGKKFVELPYKQIPLELKNTRTLSSGSVIVSYIINY